MTEFVRPYKLESTASGGTQNDGATTEIDPINDSIPIASICYQRTGNAVDNAVQTYRTSADEMAFVDKVSGTKTLSQILAAASSSNGISALTGDVTASGSGSVAATVASVGGASAANVASAAALVAATRAINTFYAGPASGNASSGAWRALVAADLPTVPLAKLDTTNAASGYVPTYNGTSYVAAAIAALSALTGDVSASGSGSQAATVNTVGGQSASNVASATALVSGSKSANFVLAAPNGAAGALAARALVAADIPTIAPTQVSGLLTPAATATASTTALRDTAGALSFAPPMQTFTGSSNTHNAVATESNAVYQLQGAGSSNAVTINLPSLSGSLTAQYAMSHLAVTGSTFTVNQSNAIFYPGPSNSYVSGSGLVSTLQSSWLNLAVSPGGNNFVVTSVMGAWKDTSGNYLVGSIYGGATANQVFASAASGTGIPGLRALVAADIPTLPLTKLSTSGATNNQAIVYNGTSAVWGTVTASATVTYPLTASSGSASAPSYSFSAATGSGMWLDGSGNANISNGGTNIATFGSYGMVLQGVLSATSTVTSLGLVLNGGTTGALTINPPASVTSYTLTLPAAKGTAGQTLITDASGNLSWGSASGSGGFPASMTAKTSAYTVTTADAYKMFCDSGATAQVVFTLPSAPSNGFTVGFQTMNLNSAGRIKVVASGSDKMRYWDSSSTTLTSATVSGHSGYGGCIVVIYYSGAWYTWGGYAFDWTFS